MTDLQRWQAVLDNDRRYDGVFFYGVASTGIFCRPSCPSRPPRRDRVRFFPTADAALAAGFRPCKRCRPDLTDFSPGQDAAAEAMAILHRHFRDQAALSATLNGLGLSRRRLADLFQAAYGTTLHGCLGTLRVTEACRLLRETDLPVAQVAGEAGFDSLSAFYRAFRSGTGQSPLAYRRSAQSAADKSSGPSLATCIRLQSLHHFDPDLRCNRMWMIFHKPSPVGMLTLSSDGTALTGLWLEGQKYFGAGLPDAVKETDLPVFEQASAWLDAYFAKAPLPALPPLAPQGSPFRQAVWRLLLEIPYGTVTTYGALARTLRDRGISAAAQAVGGAVGHNPISILIPCHRVVGSDGSLTGYAGGVANKQFLLELEGVDMTGLYVPTRGTAL